MKLLQPVAGTKNYNYYESDGFEIRMGKFNDPNSYHNGDKWEIRILHRNAQVIEALLEKLKDDLK